MTAGIQKNSSRRALLTALLFCAAVGSAVFLSGELADGVREGILLCARTVAPAIFPFLLVSDLLIAYCDFGSLPLLPKLFHKLFGISPAGVAPFLIGILCGFPLGVKATSDLFRAGAITREEAERLIGFCNNTGPAFLIAGIGIGLRGSFRDGVILWISVILSAMAVGMFFRYNNQNNKIQGNIIRQKYSFVSSVRSSGEKLIGVCAFVLTFSALAHLLRFALGGRTLLLSLLLPLLEVGTACSFLAKEAALPSVLSMLFTGFAVGFSGLSVHTQSLFFLSGSGLSARRYFPMKLVQGVLCAAFCALFSMLAKRFF